ncbi:hypothetical protein FOPE_10328 [Fonsecaea pedrosoi]|nr:hypothetical protein FOPE_10328 [Fonsecaea pedrosoi]
MRCQTLTIPESSSPDSEESGQEPVPKRRRIRRRANEPAALRQPRSSLEVHSKTSSTTPTTPSRRRNPLLHLLQAVEDDDHIMVISSRETTPGPRAVTPRTLIVSNFEKPNPCLMGLCDNVLRQIVDLVSYDSPRTVHALRMCCRRTAEVAEPTFCRTLITTSGVRSTGMERLLQARPERCAYVKTVAAYPKYAWPAESLKATARLLPRLPHLEVLHITETLSIGDRIRLSEFMVESNDEFFSVLSNAITVSTFVRLKVCTIISAVERPVSIKRILQSPCLSSLAVSYPYVDPQDPDLPRRNSTPLKHLTLFVSPFANLEVLACILGMPTALETLAIDDSCHRLPDSSFPGILGATLPTLGSLQPGLKTLKVYCVSSCLYTVSRHTGDLDFRSLQQLQELSFSNHGVCPVNCFVNLPPTLQTLRFNGPISQEVFVKKLFDLSTQDQRFSCPPNIKIDLDYQHYIEYNPWTSFVIHEDDGDARHIVRQTRALRKLTDRFTDCKRVVVTERWSVLSRRMEFHKNGWSCLQDGDQTLNDKIEAQAHQAPCAYLYRPTVFGRNDLTIFKQNYLRPRPCQCCNC